MDQNKTSSEGRDLFKKKRPWLKRVIIPSFCGPVLHVLVTDLPNQKSGSLSIIDSAAQGKVPTHSLTTKNCTPKFITFGLIAWDTTGLITHP
ncbi:hypothetical protein OUZ56_012282 [Daphnia magna]|uniref:Uncharacterized protein n=1 Tax=Daphnia magna TaxID=35525 RepID=A0ABQ9Z2P2_9CRUS|nr:hypothetical protein OUZ56_012282 [Daphnia magna]